MSKNKQPASQKLKIAVFHLAFVFSGGGEKLVMEQVKSLWEKGHQVDCFAPIIDRRTCFPDQLTKLNIKEIIPGISRLFYWRPTLAVLIVCTLMPFMVWRFRRYDVLYGANQPAPWFCYLINRVYKIPYAIYLAQPTRILYPRAIDRKVGLSLRHKLKFLPKLVKHFRFFIKWVDHASIRQAKVMLTNGEYIGHILEKIYGKAKVICPAGCYPIKKNELDSRSPWQGRVKVNGYQIDKPYVLLTGRHAPQKNMEAAIKAMDKVWPAFPQIKLVITGKESDYTNYLNKLVKKRSAIGRVVFLGLVTEDKLMELYQQAAVYVYPSYEEDFGMGVIEAMAAGTPVVTWRIAGPATTVIHNKTGYLIKPYQNHQFGQAIQRLLASRKLNQQYSQSAWQRSKRFSYQKHYEILERELFRASRH